MSKQITITIMVKEQVIGATVLPRVKRGPVTLDHVRAWELIAGGATDWERGKAIEPRDGEDYVLWYKKLSERISRVLRSRSFKTTVKNGPDCPQGYPLTWTVTVYWNRPTKSPIDAFNDIDGIWTLYEVKQGQRRGKIVTRIHATLGCDGEELYDHLPEDASSYLVDPFDVGHVWVTPKAGDDPSYHFHFRRAKVDA